ncbi:hypothetical protein RB195_004832 [Necator americanus]|uniref:snRNA-activating protein complex subunit 3 n=1 Tax=Necator americanus TaxID=51031 RepID=A0ABR1BLU3_NECAM
MNVLILVINDVRFFSSDRPTRMAMDEIFHFEDQEFVSDVVVLSDFFCEALRGRDSLRFFGVNMGEKNAWRTSFVPWLQRMNLVTYNAPIDIKQLIDSVSKSCRHATKQYNYEKDGGRTQIHLNKRTHLRCIKILQELNGKRRNPQYKSISLRSMLYDKYDASMFVHRNLKLDREEHARTFVDEVSSPSKEETSFLNGPLPNSLPPPSYNFSVYNPYEDTYYEPGSAVNMSNEVAANWNHDYGGTCVSSPSSSLDIKPDCSQCPDTPNEFAPSLSFQSLPSVTSFTEEFTDYCGNSSRFQEIILYQSQEANFGDERYDVKDVEIGSEQLNSHSTLKSSEMMPKDAKLETNPLPEATVSSHSNTIHPFQSYSPPFAANITQQSFPDDIVAEVAVFIGYPRSLEKHEIRLGRLNVIDCTSDYQVFDDVSDRPLTNEDFCKNRFPSSYFFIHDTFYIDLEPEGAQDITVEVRRWASERKIAEIKVADMNTTRIVDVTCRFGAPYLYNHVGACEHLVVITRAALRDVNHPSGPYPHVLAARRRQLNGLCGNMSVCRVSHNFYVAAPYYDRRSRRAGVLDMQSTVKQEIQRSRSTPPKRNLRKEAEAKRRIDLENQRLMRSLMSIATRPNGPTTTK